jgi:eukaryotic-like serine/threonine-protein kinase
MDTSRWESVKDLLHQAMQLKPAERGPFLDEACFSDLSLRAEVESLLSAEEDVRSSFLESPPLADDSMGIDPLNMNSSGLEPGVIVAQRFRLEKKLGEGGMGQVWLTEQMSPVHRQVALKLIKAGMYDASVAQRFQAERQSLAIMDHPAIAKVFEAGATELGQPYFVMEYVPGLPITEYSDQKRLTIKQRLELFIQACDGVQHAHQKAFIHRDLKPANILVVEVDGKPVPRIIDFGLAKATAAEEGETMFTQAGSLVGTPTFMSPEQADPATLDIDTRTDVYSLGVILYLLLTGALPIEMKQWQKQPLEALQRLREEEPKRPSTKVSTDRETSSAAAAARGAEPAQLVSLLRGDLDWIAMKALEKDRTRRYGTPSELAADLTRYLGHEPVAARPASTGYRLGKYVRRHRLAVTIAAALVILLAAFSILQAVELRRIIRERDRANSERDRATRITDFMTSMFQVSDPSEARGSSVTAREILDKASNDLPSGLAKDPEVQAQMLQVMATTYTNLGLYSRAHELAERAFNTRMARLGGNDPKTLESMSLLGWILDRQGHYEEAEKLERQALAHERRSLAPDAALTIETMDHLSDTVAARKDWDGAEKLAREALAASTRSLGAESPQALHSMKSLGVALWSERRYNEAEQEYRQLLVIDQRVRGPDHPETLKAMSNLALVLNSEGRRAESERLTRDALARYQRVLGPEHQITLRTMENLADLLADEGRLAEAVQLQREVLAIFSRTLGPEHPDTLLAKYILAEWLSREGKFREAEILARQAVTGENRTFGPTNPSSLDFQTTLANILIRAGRYAEAEKIARDAFEVEIRTLRPQHPYTIQTLQTLGTALAHMHRYPEAAKLFREVIEKADSPSQASRFQVWYSFACVAAAAGRPDDALQYLGEAVHRGYRDADGLMYDENLKALRPNPNFQQLVSQLRQPTQPH